LTVHDFASAVHPWLMNLREDILAALGTVLDHKPWLPETKLMGFPPLTGVSADTDGGKLESYRKWYPLHDRLPSMHAP
ncbi:hypothetical protein N657DRAFT_573893, partial [Parathielavia appendiculata]